MQLDASTSRPPFLGVQVSTQGNSATLAVLRVIPGYGAAAAGIRQGDVVTCFAGVKVRNFDHLRKTIEKQQFGARIQIKVRRAGRELAFLPVIGVRTAALAGDHKEPFTTHLGAFAFIYSTGETAAAAGRWAETGPLMERALNLSTLLEPERLGGAWRPGIPAARLGLFRRRLIVMVRMARWYRGAAAAPLRLPVNAIATADSRDDPAARQLTGLVKRLGDPDFKVRQRATRALAAAGVRAVPYLRGALGSQDLEVRHRAAQLLHRVRGETPQLPRFTYAPWEGIVTHLDARKGLIRIESAFACGARRPAAGHRLLVVRRGRGILTLSVVEPLKDGVAVKPEEAGGVRPSDRLVCLLRLPDRG